MRSLFFAIALTCSSLAHAATPSHQAAAEQLFDMMKLRELLATTTDSVLESQMEVNPMLRDYEGVMKEFLTKYLGYEALKPDLVAMYTDEFSEAELRDMIAFYQTPTGRKAIEALPRLQQQSSLLGQQKVAEHTDELEQMMLARALELAGGEAAPVVDTPMPESTPPAKEDKKKKKGKGD